MARRKHVEETRSHEAWAIPYADLLTLLLAFFVVMYATSSLNESKYRVMADALSTAFGGSPRTIAPVQVGHDPVRSSTWQIPTPIKSGASRDPTSPATDPSMLPSMAAQMRPPESQRERDHHAAKQRQMEQVEQALIQTLAPLIEAKQISVRRDALWIEVQINSDILFATGSARLDRHARDTLSRLAKVLHRAPNGVRVEGYTDNQPIATAQFPSNWELSAARAASVVHLLADQGIAPARLAMVGYGEFRPRADNGTEAGRNANRRVVLIILADSDASLAPVPPSQGATAPVQTTDPRTVAPGKPPGAD